MSNTFRQQEVQVNNVLHTLPNRYAQHSDQISWLELEIFWCGCSVIIWWGHIQKTVVWSQVSAVTDGPSVETFWYAPSSDCYDMWTL